MCTGIPVRIKSNRKCIGGNLIFARTMEFGADMKSKLRFTPAGTKFNAKLQLNKNTDKLDGTEWKSEYAIFGPTAMGTDSIIEGINENGLNVSGFYFPGYAEYQPFPVDQHKLSVSIGPLDVVQYLLGTCKNVAEAGESLKGVNVCCSYLPALKEFPPLHWIIQSKNEPAIVIEYLKGELNIIKNPLNVLTNSPNFKWHMTNLRNYVNLSYNNAQTLELTGGEELTPFGQGSGMLGLPGDFTPPSRFVRAVALSQSVALPGASSSPETDEEGVNMAWNLIDNIAIPIGAARSPDKELGKDEQDDYTQWVSVSDLTNLKYYYRTYNNQNIRVVDVEQLIKNESDIVEIPMNQDIEYQDVTPHAPI
ncbi:MAG: choloylglycine hydrolase family protein [Photobacterium aquimaris]|nr:choloylglycine hydrolase family protein [Photobacterium aquimaris]